MALADMHNRLAMRLCKRMTRFVRSIDNTLAFAGACAATDLEGRLGHCRLETLANRG
jgi:hypothetical protein